MKITKLRDIKAKYKTNWTNKNMKFKMGDVVTVAHPRSYDSSPIRLREGWAAKVVAVSCTSDGSVRGKVSSPGRVSAMGRQFTRYFVQFADDRIIGIHSHTLKKV